MKTLDFILPSYYAGAMINGDYDGLTDDEFKMLTDFVHDNMLKYGRFDCVEADVENVYFSSHNELTGMRHLGSDVCKYTFVIE